MAWALPRAVDTQFGTMPVAAWGLRKLVSGYTGALIRVRDGFDNSEQDVGFDPATGKLDTFSTTGTAYITKIYNQVGGSDHLIQTTTANQPTITTTPGGWYCASFDGSNDFMLGDTLGTARPYMVAKPVILFGYGGAAPSSDYAVLFQIPNADGSNASPYYRITFGRAGGVDAINSGINGTGNGSFKFGSDTGANVFADAMRGWMVFVASTVTGSVYGGNTLSSLKPFATTSVTYPNNTRIRLGSSGAGGDVRKGYFTEMVIWDNLSISGSPFREYAEEIRLRTMVAQTNGKEYRFEFGVNFAGTKTTAFCELELALTAGGADQLTTSGILWDDASSYTAGGEYPKNIVDNNNSTIWSSFPSPFSPFGLTFQLPVAYDAYEFRIKARNDVYYNAAPKLLKLRKLIDGEFVQVGDYDLTSAGNSAGQVYTLLVTIPISGSISDISPTSGDDVGGTAVTITGVGFTSATGVTFGGSAATSFVVVSDTEITCTTPSHSSGAVDVVVLRPEGDITETAGFTYINTAIATEVTQLPILVIGSPPDQSIRTTQLPILVLSQENKPVEATSLPILTLWDELPFPPPSPFTPEIGITETWEWRTAINIKENGNEQRAALRANPRVASTLPIVLEDDLSRQKLMRLYFEYLKQPFDYPVYQYCANITNTVGDTITFAVNTTNLKDGSIAVLCNHVDETVKIVTIQEMTPTGCILTGSAPTGVYHSICPVNRFRFTPELSLSMTTISGMSDMTMEGYRQTSVLRQGQLTNLLTIYDGMVVLDKRPLANGEIGEAISQDVEWLDNGTNRPQPMTGRYIPFVITEQNYTAFRPAGELDYWRNFANYVKGSLRSFLLPSFRNDVELSEIPTPGSFTLVSSNLLLEHLWRTTSWKYIRISNDDGVIYRRVNSCIVNYNETGKAISVTLNLNAAIPSVNNLHVGFVNTCRIDNDRIELVHDSLYTGISFSTRTVEK